MKPVIIGEDGAGGHAVSIEMDGRLYTYSYSAETNVGPKYVPDNDLSWALRESVQNLLDESLHCFGTIGCQATEDSVFLTDKGRGVDFDTIFVIGESNKRAEENAVGTHGEGEPISFLIAARLGVMKLMASKDWLCTARFARQTHGTKQVAFFDVFKTPTPRVGTCWYYGGFDLIPQCTADAFVAFSRHYAFNLGKQGVMYAAVQKALIAAGADMPDRPPYSSKKLIVDEPHMFYSRGLQVGEGPWDLALGYNFQATPGRDRAGFQWKDVGEEAQSLFASSADADAIQACFEWSKRNGQVAREFQYPHGPDVAIVRKGLTAYKRISGFKQVAWANGDSTDAALVADAVAMPDVYVFKNYYGIPQWLKDVLPHVSTIVTPGQIAELDKPLAKPVREAAFTLLSMCGMTGTPVVGRKLTENFEGAGDKIRIILDPAKTKGMAWPHFVEVLVHEAAHVYSDGASDCSRAHTNAVSNLSVKLMEAVAGDPIDYSKVRSAYIKWAQEA